MTTLPSVGRIVHFFTTDQAKHANGQGTGPYPAMVMQVFNQGATGNQNYSTMSNLRVLRWDGNAAAYDEGSVCEYNQAQANGDHGRWWVWPPRD